VLRTIPALTVLILVSFQGALAAERPTPPAAAEEQPAQVKPDYRLLPGDVLIVSVWKEQDLTREVLIQPDGGFSFPLAGHLVAQGHTVDEVRTLLVKRLEKYIPDPEVAVAIKEVVGNKFFVIGKVAKPGEFLLKGPVDVMQALSSAGGPSTFASVNSIKVLRRKGEGQESIPFRYGDVEDGKNLEQNILLQNGDVVVVP
jgi:polysaccharide biosynthesis/export protein